MEHDYWASATASCWWWSLLGIHFDIYNFNCHFSSSSAWEACANFWFQNVCNLTLWWITYYNRDFQWRALKGVDKLDSSIQVPHLCHYLILYTYNIQGHKKILNLIRTTRGGLMLMKQLDLVSNKNPKLYELRYEGNHRYGEKSSTEVISFAPKRLWKSVSLSLSLYMYTYGYCWFMPWKNTTSGINKSCYNSLVYCRTCFLDSDVVQC